jgi:hypothetical protein
MSNFRMCAKSNRVTITERFFDSAKSMSSLTSLIFLVLHRFHQSHHIAQKSDRIKFAFFDDVKVCVDIKQGQKCKQFWVIINSFYV